MHAKNNKFLTNVLHVPASLVVGERREDEEGSGLLGRGDAAALILTGLAAALLGVRVAQTSAETFRRAACCELDAGQRQQIARRCLSSSCLQQTSRETCLINPAEMQITDGIIAPPCSCTSLTPQRCKTGLGYFSLKDKMLEIKEILGFFNP